jgi:N-acetyl-anhydromuramyl-L-alanine amidase AmpD
MPSTVQLGSKGSDVSLLQKDLNKLGTQPQLIVDGDFGQKTDDAVRRFQAANHLAVDGICGPKTWAAIDAVLAAVPPPPASPIPGVEFYDRRAHAAQSHGGYAVTERDFSTVTGACLHQTACNLGERVERYDTVGAHFALTRGCKVIWMHDFTHKVAAANGWNNATVSIEIDGLYAGVEGDPSTVWNDPSTPGKDPGQVFTPEMAETLRKLLRWIKARLGHQMNAIVAHRQASEDRPSDPGSAIWVVALEMHQELGCSDGGIGFTLGDGLPIPEKWDPRCKGIPY